MAAKKLWAEFIRKCEDIDRKNKSKLKIKCNVAGSEYCKNEYPLCRLVPEKTKD